VTLFLKEKKEGKSRSYAAKNIAGSEARWREEVMPGKDDRGSDADAYASGGKKQKKERFSN